MKFPFLFFNIFHSLTTHPSSSNNSLFKSAYLPILYSKYLNFNCNQVWSCKQTPSANQMPSSTHQLAKKLSYCLKNQLTSVNYKLEASKGKGQRIVVQKSGDNGDKIEFALCLPFILLFIPASFQLQSQFDFLQNSAAPWVVLTPNVGCGPPGTGQQPRTLPVASLPISSPCFRWLSLPALFHFHLAIPSWAPPSNKASQPISYGQQQQKRKKKVIYSGDNNASSN
jgi:hypothetical protein